MEEFDEAQELERIKALKEQQSREIVECDINEQSCPKQEIAIAETTNNYEVQVQDNKLVNAVMENDTALEIAKAKFEDIKNQKNLANKMGKVVNKKANTDIETADLKVEQQRLANKVEKARQKNELLKAREERKYLIKESKHKMAMQKFAHRKEKYADLLLRHCRKKVKGANGKWEYQFDKNGNAIINMPNAFTLFWLIVFDSIVMFLNQTADIFAGLNKVVFKIFWILLICLILFVPPVRQWLFGLIGIKFG